MEDFLQLDQNIDQEAKLIRDNLRRWVNQEVLPQAAAAFEQGQFPMALIPQMAKLGLFGLNLPQNYGGAAASYMSYGLACQELERGDSALRSFISVQNSLCIHPIFTFGTEEQKQHYLPRMVRGELIGCFGLTEADSGSDPSGMTTHAQKTNQGWLLNGAKMWISNATIADLAIIWAKTTEGIRGFIVEKDTPGFSSQAIKHKMSLRMADTGELILTDCTIPAENLLPGTSIGLKAALSCLNKARYGIAWGAMGAAMACFDCTLNYSQQRKQFGRPIASFQMIQKDLVDMFTEIVKSQTLNYQLGHLADQGALTPEMISMGKMNAARCALDIARKCRNLLGANGISLEYSVIRHMLNLESVFTYEGTDNIHHLILGNHLTGYNAFS